MIQKKICMLGAFAVGKTSLVARYVQSVFSEKYHTTVGVKIDKKSLTVDGTEITMVLWDLHGEDAFQSVRMSYLRGSSGYLLVADGTRKDTLETALDLQARTESEVGSVPFIFLVNKADLQDNWEIQLDALTELEQRGWTVLQTSAKTGEGVEEAFTALSRMMLQD